MGWKMTRYRGVQLRMVLLLLCVLVLSGLVLSKAYTLQVVESAELGEKQERLTQREMTLRARRGSILDSSGVELAVSVDVVGIYANPRLLDDPMAATRQLKAVMDEDLDEQVVLRRLSDRRRQFVWIAHKVSPEKGDQVKALKIPGVGLTPESKRYYPLKARAGHMLGFVGGEENGLEGLERTFNKELQGGEYVLPVMRDAGGRKIYLGDEPEFTALEGSTLVLTLDERIQYIVETELAHMVKQSDAKGATIIVSDPRTGDLLAMATATREALQFNPNRFGDYDASSWRNRAISDAFEPGSTFKAFVLAAALEEGEVKLDDVFDVEHGRMRIGEYTISDTHPEKRLSARDIIKYSSNIGAYKIARELGRERFGSYLKAFGFGETTGVPLRGERRGLLRDPKKWPEITLANIAFGQGLMVTHLQLHMALGAIANGGKLMHPRLVKEVRDRSGAVVQRYEPEVRRQVVSEETARKVRESLMGVVEEGGTGTKASLAYHKVAGKTGTAQKVDPRTRRYSEWLWVASFIGMVPAERPALVITVIADEPRNGHYGGAIAGPTFSRIADQVLPLMDVYPPGGAVVEDAKAALPVPVAGRAGAGGGGDEEEESVGRPVPSYSNGVAAPSIPSGMTPMPSYIGLSLREVVRRSRELGHLVHIEGAGVVVQQWPSPGVYVGEQVPVRVKLGETGGAQELDLGAEGE